MALEHGLTGPQWQLVEKFEDEKNAYFLGCFPVGGLNCLCFVFYSHEKHPRGSNYFGIYYNSQEDSWMVINAGSVEGKQFQGLEKQGRVYYSRFRHDLRKNGKDIIDGGWDYCRYQVVSKAARIVHCKIVNGRVEVNGGASVGNKTGAAKRAKKQKAKA